MSITVSSQIGWIETKSFFEDPTTYLIGIPCGTRTEVDIPSYWIEKPAGEGNDVCHVKLLEPSFMARDSSRTFPVKTGYAWLQHGSNADWQYQLYDASHDSLVRYYVHWWYPGQTFQISVYYDYIYRYVYGVPYCYRPWVMQAYVLRDGQWVRSTRTNYGYCSSATAELGRTYMDLAIHASDIPLHGGRGGSFGDSVFFRIMKNLTDVFDLYFFRGSRSFTADPLLALSVQLPPKPMSSYLLFGEDDSIFGIGYSTVPYAQYHLNALRQKAYLDALDHIPQLNDNNLSNIIEIVGFIKSLVVDHRIEIPRSLQSAWLSYRYVYNTTKLDVKEAVDFVNRHYNVSRLLGTGISCYGLASTTYKGVEVTVRCRIEATQKELSYLDKIWTGLYKYGLSPSFYAIWDMIPYSFIVDWFIPVGEILDGYDKTRMYDRTYDFSNIWFSVTYVQIDQGSKIKAYSRWTQGSPPEFQGYYTLENKGTTSNKVIGYRILDTLSLIFK